MELDSAVQDHWKCPICLELLYKPCVNTCGHVFCFWCMHRSMDPFTPSQCPLCRAEYAHFPQVCEQLHFFLQKAFPVAYQEREVDTREEETTSGIYSLELRQGQAHHKQDAVQAPEATSGWSEWNFPCSACSELLYNPVVLNCGHAVCHATCRPQAQARVDPVCPRCDAPVVGCPAVCTQWQDQLLQLLPQQMQLRGVKLAAALSLLPSPEPGQALSGQAAPNADPADNPQQGPGGEDTDATAASRLRRRLLHAIRQDFSHHGVGCDACGLYPIKGRRYACTDCPDKVGFDLCGKCYDKELHIVGRFNQQHTPDHNMSLVRPMPTIFHIVQAANPELSMAQIRQLAGLAFERSEELVARQPPPGAPVPTSTPPSATNPGASTDVQASTAAGTTASRININGGAAAAQAEADAAGRVNGDASAADSGADTAGRLAYRADAGREEASTWANAFVSEAQRAADAAEQETRGHSRAGNARQESADLSRQPGSAGQLRRPSSVRRWFGSWSESSGDQQQQQHPLEAAPRQRGAQRGGEAVPQPPASSSLGRSAANQNTGHDPTGQNWRWNLAPWNDSPASSSRASRVIPSEPQPIPRLTPRRARESSGDGIATSLARPWRRRRVQSNSPDDAGQQQNSRTRTESGSRAASTGSWRRLLPSFLGNILSSDAPPQNQAPRPYSPPRGLATLLQPHHQHSYEGADDAAVPEPGVGADHRSTEAQQLPSSTQAQQLLEHPPVAPQWFGSTQLDNQQMQVPALPAVPNVWDGELGGPTQGADNLDITNNGSLPNGLHGAELVDYAQGGDDPNMEHDAMMLILHAMQARQEGSSFRSERGSDEGLTEDRQTDEQYWRSMEAAHEAAFNSSEQDGMPDLDPI